MSVDNLISFIEPFIQGVIHTLKVQCHTPVTPGELKMKKMTDTNEPSIDIAGVIGVTSDQFTGSIAICFPKQTYLAVMSQMLGEEFSELTPDIEDGAGELANIIYGTAKRILSDRGHIMQKALPGVVRADKLQIRHLSTTPVLTLPFSTERGNFHVEIAIELVAKNVKRSA